MSPAFVVATPPLAAAEIGPQDWEVRPSGDDIARYYPDSAMKRGLAGRVTIVCIVTGQGEMSDCKVTHEYPLAEHFGDAAIRLSTFFKLRLDTPRGPSNVGRLATIPIRFALQPTSAVQSADIEGAAACYGQIAHVVAHAQTDGQSWNAALFWLLKLGVATANGHGTPYDIDDRSRRAREAGEEGTLKVPAGYDLATCMSKVAGK